MEKKQTVTSESDAIKRDLRQVLRRVNDLYRLISRVEACIGVVDEIDADMRKDLVEKEVLVTLKSAITLVDAVIKALNVAWRKYNRYAADGDHAAPVTDRMMSNVAALAEIKAQMSAETYIEKLERLLERNDTISAAILQNWWAPEMHEEEGTRAMVEGTFWKLAEAVNTLSEALGALESVVM